MLRRLEIMKAWWREREEVKERIRADRTRAREVMVRVSRAELREEDEKPRRRARERDWM
jgi:hypothetical protein